MRKIVDDKKPINRLSVGERRRQKPINRLSVFKVLIFVCFVDLSNWFIES